MKRITINEVADEAGVSRQTVSRAINDKAEISPETRERVLTAVEKLGYRPNRLAQGMVTQRTRTVGLEVPNITNPVFAEIVRGAQDVAIENKYHLLLANSADDPVLALDALATLIAQGVDAVIGLLAAVLDKETLAFADTFRPLILINRHLEHPNISSVNIDIERGATLAVTHFIEQGHRAIGMLANSDAPPESIRRVRGYQAVLQQAGLPNPDGWIAHARPSLDGGYAAATELLTTHPDITAIFAYNDLMATGALRACHDLGRAVPNECAIIGFDDIPLASVVTPTLSTVSYDKHALGQQAMRRALAMIEDRTTPFPPLELPLRLVLRESSRPPG